MTTPDDKAPFREPHLCADDERLLDALAEAGFDRNILSNVSGDDDRRLGAICRTMGLLRDYPVEDASDTLVHATLARIDQHEEAHAARMSFDNHQNRFNSGRSGFRIRIPDFITVAAVLLIGFSVLWPVLSTARQRSMDTLCADNLKHLAYAFGQYADDNNTELPVAMAGIGSGALSWDKISNVLNLEPLVRGNYCEGRHLNCPGHQHNDANAAGPSYSYRWFLPGSRTGWGTGRMMTVLVGDMNPMVNAARNGQFIPPLSISPNHGGRGQNVLVSDGSIMWLEIPIVGRNDNIWLPHGSSQLHNGDQPADESDVMLTQ